MFTVNKTRYIWLYSLICVSLNFSCDCLNSVMKLLVMLALIGLIISDVVISTDVCPRKLLIIYIIYNITIQSVTGNLFNLVVNTCNTSGCIIFISFKIIRFVVSMHVLYTRTEYAHYTSIYDLFSKNIPNKTFLFLLTAKPSMSVLNTITSNIGKSWLI